MTTTTNDGVTMTKRKIAPAPRGEAKRCMVCHQWFPRTAEFFASKRPTLRGTMLDNRCHQCAENTLDRNVFDAVTRDMEQEFGPFAGWDRLTHLEHSRRVYGVLGWKADVQRMDLLIAAERGEVVQDDVVVQRPAPGPTPGALPTPRVQRRVLPVDYGSPFFRPAAEVSHV